MCPYSAIVAVVYDPGIPFRDRGDAVESARLPDGLMRRRGRAYHADHGEGSELRASNFRRFTAVVRRLARSLGSRQTGCSRPRAD